MVEAARTDGPQVVTRHGREVAVVVSIDDYREMTGGSVKEALRDLAEATTDDFQEILEEIVAERRLHPPREIDFGDWTTSWTRRSRVRWGTGSHRSRCGSGWVTASRTSSRRAS